MTFEKVPNTNVAILGGDEVIATTNQALDMIADLSYQTELCRVVIPKERVDEAFFDLRSGLAGEILQKFITYGVKAAFVGDFSVYQSKALRDFIFESNNGRDIFFLATQEEAVSRLENAR